MGCTSAAHPLVRQNSLVYGGYSHAKHRHDQKRPDQRPNQKLDEIFAFHLTYLAIRGSPPRDNNVQTKQDCRFLTSLAGPRIRDRYRFVGQSENETLKSHWLTTGA